MRTYWATVQRAPGRTCDLGVLARVLAFPQHGVMVREAMGAADQTGDDGP